MSADIELAVHRAVQKEAERLGCVVLAVNGMEDHIHLLVQAPPTLAPSLLAQQVKGVSSTFVRDTLRIGEPFSWQDNYAVFSLGPSDLPRVLSYVQKQKEHHSSGQILSGLEATFTEVPSNTDAPTPQDSE